MKLERVPGAPRSWVITDSFGDTVALSSEELLDLLDELFGRQFEIAADLDKDEED